MNKCYALFSAFLLLFSVSAAHAKPAAKTKFQADIAALLQSAGATMGFDSLKGTEIARGEWACKLELDGFVTTIREKEDDPRGVLYMSAVSVRPVAYKYAGMLAVNGLHGYKLRDSDKDNGVPIDKTTQARKLIFSRQGKYVSTILTVVFVAQGDNAVLLTVETR